MPALTGPVLRRLAQNLHRPYRELREMWAAVLTRVYVPLLQLHYSISFGAGVRFYGRPVIRGPGRITIGPGCILSSWRYMNPAGNNHRCILATLPGGEIRAGAGFVGSGISIVAATQVVLGDNVMLGVGSAIYDTDFHPLDHSLRARPDNMRYARARPVTIGHDVWVGAGVLILKGVTIGDRAVIAAGAVVTHDVPADSVVAGNPIRVVKTLPPPGT